MGYFDFVLFYENNFLRANGPNNSQTNRPTDIWDYRYSITGPDLKKERQNISNIPLPVYLMIIFIYNRAIGITDAKVIEVHLLTTLLSRAPWLNKERVNN